MRQELVRRGREKSCWRWLDKELNFIGPRADIFEGVLSPASAQRSY
jgi:hypothetical protein